MKSNRTHNRLTQQRPAAPAVHGAVETRVAGLVERGLALYRAGKVTEAQGVFQAILHYWPNQSDALQLLGHIAHGNKNYLAALQLYDRSIASKAGNWVAYNNRGVTLLQLGRKEEALEDFERAISLRPSYADAHYNRGLVLTELACYEQAAAAFTEVVRFNANHFDAHMNCAAALSRLGEFERALDCIQQALSLNPDAKDLAGRGLLFARHICAWDCAEHLLEKVEQEIDDGKRAIEPFPASVYIDSPARLHKAIACYVQDQFGAREPATQSQWKPRNGKIKIGYFSADFYEHATTHLVAELFELHDKTQFETYGFSYGPVTGDAMERRVAKTFDHFIPVAAMPAAEIAALSRDYGIDIAVDMKGFTANHRHEIFLERAAPVQVSYLGYPATTGSACIDYLIADATLIPESNRKYYSEKIIYLPGSYQANDSRRAISRKTVSRKESGLPDRGVVFCCFNSCYKITRAVFQSWMRILDRVAGSVLWLYEGNRWVAANLRREASRCGVDPARLVFAKNAEHQDHLARYQLADLFLDTLPCNAHTTASDALWAGLPLLTCMGETFAGRVAASLLNAVKLPELIVHSLDEYEELAVELGMDDTRLSRLKEKLRSGQRELPLFDTAAYTRSIEWAFRHIHQRRLEGRAADHVSVPPSGA